MLQAYDLPKQVVEKMEVLQREAQSYCNKEKEIKKIFFQIENINKEIQRSAELTQKSGNKTVADAHREEIKNRGARTFTALFFTFRATYKNGLAAFAKFVRTLEQVAAREGTYLSTYTTTVELFWNNPEFFGRPMDPKNIMIYRDIKRLVQKNGHFTDWVERLNAAHIRIIPWGEAGDVNNSFKSHRRMQLAVYLLAKFVQACQAEKPFKIFGFELNQPNENKLFKRFDKIWDEFIASDGVQTEITGLDVKDEHLGDNKQALEQQFKAEQDALQPLEESIRRISMDLLEHFPSVQSIIEKFYSIYETSNLPQMAIEIRSHLNYVYSKVKVDYANMRQPGKGSDFPVGS